MEKNVEGCSERIAKMETSLKKLPVELQNAICWGIEHLGSLQEIGKQSKMTPEEIQAAMENALAKKEYATLILLYITGAMRKSEKNEEF